MKELLMGVLVFLGIVVIILELIQAGKAESASAAFSGGSSDLFSQVKERGSEKMLSRITMACGLAFIAVSFVITSLL